MSSRRTTHPASRSLAGTTALIGSILLSAVVPVSVAAAAVPPRSAAGAAREANGTGTPPSAHTPCRHRAAAPPAAPARIPRGSSAPGPRLYAVDNHVPAGRPHAPYLVDVIDPRSDRVVSKIRVRAQPHHIYVVPHSNEAYVTHFVGCSMDVINLVTDKVIGQVATKFGPRHLTFSPDGRYAYAIDYYGAHLSIIATRTNKTVATIPTGDNPNYPATTRSGRRVFVVNTGSGNVTVAQARPPFHTIATVPVGPRPFDLALTPDGTRMLVTNAGDDTVSVIATRTLKVLATIPIRRSGPDSSESSDQKLNIRITGNGRYAWVGDQLGSAFSVISIPRLSLVSRIPAASGADIFNELDSGPAKGKAITTARYGAYADVVSTRRPRLLRRINTARSLPHASARSFQGDSGPRGSGSHMMVTNPAATRAYLSDRPGDAVTVLSLRGRSPHYLATIPTGYAGQGFPDGLAYVTFRHGWAHSTSNG